MAENNAKQNVYSVGTTFPGAATLNLLPDTAEPVKPQSDLPDLIPLGNPYETPEDDVEMEDDTPIPTKPSPKQNDNVIALPDDKIPVTFIFPVVYEGKERSLSVGLDACSVSIDATSISLLYAEDTRLEFPVPAAFTIEYNGIERKVAYFGGKHKIGKLTYILFLLIQE